MPLGINMVYCGECAHGKQKIDEKGITTTDAIIGVFGVHVNNPVFKCELDGKNRLGIESCDKGEKRPFSWKDLFR
jgi:hypothetical protein